MGASVFLRQMPLDLSIRKTPVLLCRKPAMRVAGAWRSGAPEAVWQKNFDDAESL